MRRYPRLLLNKPVFPAELAPNIDRALRGSTITDAVTLSLSNPQIFCNQHCPWAKRLVQAVAH